MTTAVHPKLLTVAQVARRLGVSEQSVRRRIRAGSIPAVRLGPTDRYPIRIDPAELDAWIYSEGGEAA